MSANVDWLFTIPTALDALSESFLSKKDSFKFPDSIILFESWMNLGLEALYPKIAIHFKFPGFLRGEKTRNVFQFIFSVSRGFGFPIYFNPHFYENIITYAKVLEPILRWGHSVCHKANQAINLVANRFKIKRHHPGEFESVIISEYENGEFKGIDTLLHGYFTNEPKHLGIFLSLEEALQKVTFSYSIGDHAMSVDSLDKKYVLEVSLITNDEIEKRYEVNFYSYIKKLMSINRQLKKNIIQFRKKRKHFIKDLKFIEVFKSKIFSYNKLQRYLFKDV